MTTNNHDPRSGITNGHLGIRFICIFLLPFPSSDRGYPRRATVISDTAKENQKEEGCDAMQLDIVIKGKEDGVFFFILLSLYLHPRKNHSMPFHSGPCIITLGLGL